MPTYTIATAVPIDFQVEARTPEEAELLVQGFLEDKDLSCAEIDLNNIDYISAYPVEGEEN